MAEWIDKAFKKYSPVYNTLITNFNKKAHERLRSLREAQDSHNVNFHNKMSQISLAAVVDMIPQNYNKIEKGRINGGNNITLEQAIKLSVVFGCTIDYIATGKDPAQVSSASADTIRSLTAQLETERDLNRFLKEEIERLKAKKK
jgi:transcriptional regulator with XRE-family HTH domain